jgi:predicted alpha/beta-fold hydrolase
MTESVFHPPAALRSAHLQSVMASSGLRRLLRLRGASRFLAEAREQQLCTEEGVRLQAFHNRPSRGPVRGRAILLHGWEGSHASAYVVSAAIAFLQAGWEVVRLNFRDHGATHAWNEELFHSARLTEIVEAVSGLAEASPGKLPFTLAGFSLGGNFALRVAAALPERNLSPQHVFAVSPVVDPQAAVFAMQKAPAAYRSYFLWKWGRSLRIKAAAWPGRVPLEEALAQKTLNGRTEYLLHSFGEFPDLHAYYSTYTVRDELLAKIRCPTTVWTSEDDPIIPAGSWDRLNLPRNIKLHRYARGGHCGFIDRVGDASFVDRSMVRMMSLSASASGGPHADSASPADAS